MMQEAVVHVCQCSICQRADDHPDKRWHRHMNLLLSRMDEQQRRWYVGLESLKIGHGGDTVLAQITGLNVETIRRGRQELDSDLQDHPPQRIRAAGGGRPPVEKKTPPSKPT
jgi:hypothetical protein